MFTIYTWPKKLKNNHHRSGRPPQRRFVAKISAPAICIIDELLNKNLIDETQHNTALWFQKIQALYMAAIGAPRLKNTCMDLSQLKGDQWTTLQLKKIELNWVRVQNVLKLQTPSARHSILQTLCFESECDNIQVIRRFLDDLQSEFKSFSCKKSED